jgi:hypothetical protein
MCGSLEYGIRNFVFYQPECHSNVMEIVALHTELISLPESWPPKPQDSNYIVFCLPPTTQKARIHTVALTLYPIMDVDDASVEADSAPHLISTTTATLGQFKYCYSSYRRPSSNTTVPSDAINRTAVCYSRRRCLCSSVCATIYFAGYSLSHSLDDGRYQTPP